VRAKEASNATCTEDGAQSECLEEPTGILCESIEVPFLGDDLELDIFHCVVLFEGGDGDLVLVERLHECFLVPLGPLVRRQLSDLNDK
jgi:hypothetical protein